MQYQNTQAFAQELDRNDKLARFRSQFHIPQHKGKDSIYFTGNSLGLQPKKARQYVFDQMDVWAQQGVEGHFKAKTPWVSYHDIFPVQLSGIVGALPEEIVVMNSLTVNLHLLMATFYRPTKKRYKIICEAKAFPSDQYAFESQIKLHGLDPAEALIEIAPRKGGHLIHTEDILSAIEAAGDSLALVLFGGVNYYNGQAFDMKAITEAAHRAGALAGYDLAHAAGNIVLHLHDWNVDFACWCSYKYLNSGPGGIAGAFIHQRHATNTALPRMAGWWGYDKDSRFQMKQGFRPIPTAEGWQLSNAPVLLMAAHKAALELFGEAGMRALAEKGLALSGYVHFILDELNRSLPRKVIEVITPKEDAARGCQVSMLMLERGKEIFNRLISEGVIADWREPNVIRVAPVPLYNTFEDVWKFGNVLEREVKGENVTAESQSAN
jgi:kynureninase